MGFLSNLFGGGKPFNVREMERIEKATRSNPVARNLVATELQAVWRRVVEIQDGPGQRKAIVGLLNEYTARRQMAVQLGARNHGDHRWAPPAAAETWLAALLRQDESELEQVEAFAALICGVPFPPRA